MKIYGSLLSRFRARIASTLALALIAVAAFGGSRMVVYTAPMLAGQYGKAATASTGDRALALYDQGLQLYRDGSLRAAKEVLDRSYNELTHDTGVVPPSRRELAGRIQFLLGLVDEHARETKLAVAAYEESLRQDPSNKACKYNLERLKSQNPDGGGASSPGQKPASGSGSDRKKGI